MINFCICGGGSLGHVIAGYLGANADVRVSMLTQRPQLWKNDIEVHTPEQTIIHGHIHTISSNPEDVIPQANIILLCLPGFAIKQQLQLIKPYVKSTTFVGSVFSSTGFFFNAMEILNEDVPLWGFQRVPFICRTREYGQSANLLGYKSNLNIAVERTDEKEDFRLLIEELFNTPVSMLNNFYEATLTNSNPLLHTSRLYTMFGASNEGRTFPRMILFYEEWTEEAAQLLIDMDEEFFRLLEVLPVKPNYLPRILEYYESHDARSLAQKLSSIQGFKGITSPMKQTAQGWIPDFASRYFTEDFPYGLRFIWQLAKEKGIATPKIDMVYQWGMSKI
jgi:hypothetical protein